MEDKAKELRAQGKLYREIDDALGLSRGKSWVIINRDRHNANARDSHRRYRARGCVPIYEIEDYDGY